VNAEELDPETAQPSASILLINYNGRDDLFRCLPAVIADAAGHDYEILVLDNCSTDDSVETIIQKFPQVRLIRNHVNSGFGAGNNMAARMAKGEYLAFLNADTVVKKDWLEELIKAMQSGQHVGMATSKVLLMSEPDRINACGNDIHVSGLTLCRGAGKLEGAFSKVDQVSAASGAAFVMRRDLFLAMGGFDEAFFMYMEDTDLSFRVQLAGMTIRFVPSSVVYHDYALTFGPRKTFYQERNRYLMLLKNFRVATLLVLGPAFVIAEIVTWGFIFMRERKHLFEKLDAYRWVFEHISEIWQAHRIVQNQRKVRDRDLVRRLSWRLDFEQTGKSPVSRISHLLFDPIFFAVKLWALAALWL
jgi:GT2 family glycosyltransferase